MDVKLCSYILLVFVTLELQKITATTPEITLSISNGGNPEDKPTATCTLKMDDVVSTTTTRRENDDYVSGPAGPMGLPGPVGPPGPPGSHGVCPCFDTPNTVDAVEPDGDEFGTEDFPAVVPCKSAKISIKSGTYYLGPTGKPIQVYCNMTSLETCIRINKTTTVYNHNSSKGAFWLKEMGVDLKKIYYEISAEQLIWLRDRSESVRQTLKYNCLDSVPYSKHNKSQSVKLWAWNDVVIGPYPTEQSPIYYYVPEATDECKEGSTEWKSTIIELQSSNVYRLPIVDLWIGDIRNAGQKMSIESVEVCFG